MTLRRPMVFLVICSFLALSLSTVTGAEQRKGKSKPAKRAKADKRPKRELKIPPNVTVQRDVVYGKGGGRDLHLDLFVPKDKSAVRPGIVFIHGGGWSGGSRGQFQRQAAYLAGKGYVGACIEYRLSSEAKYPAAVEDCKCAVRWMRANAKRLHIDPKRIAVCGGSAGGHLASLLGSFPC